MTSCGTGLSSPLSSLLPGHQRVAPPLHGEGHPPAGDLGLVRPQDHLQGSDGVGGAGEGLAVLLSGRDQVEDGQLVALGQGLVGHLFEGPPLLGLVGGTKERVGVDHQLAAAAPAQGEEARRADDLHAVAVVAPDLVAARVEEAHRPLSEREVGVDAVAGHRAHGLVGLTDIGFCQLPPLGGHLGRHPGHLPGKETHHIEQVGAQHDHVLPAAAFVLLAVGVQGQHLADEAFAQQALEVLDAGQVHPLVGHRHLQPSRRCLGDDAVAVLQVPGHGFFAVHVGAGLQAGQDQLQVAVGPARADTDDVGLFHPQHLLVVGVGPGRASFLLALEAAGFVGVGHGHELDLFQALVRNVQPVAVVAFAGAADGGGAIGFLAHLMALLYRRSSPLLPGQSPRSSTGRRPSVGRR